VIIAGDIFDKFNPSPQLINFAMDHIPWDTFAVAGQHDLLHHNLEDIEKSGYWTLVKAEKIQHLDPVCSPSIGRGWRATGFSWGQEIENNRDEDEKNYLCVAHQYIWDNYNHAFESAPQSSRLDKISKQLRGYNAMVAGDNHKGFYSISYDIPIFNCGSLMRRNAVQRDYKPRVGLLHKSGKIVQHFLDTSKDKFMDGEDVVKKLQEEIDLKELVKAFTGIKSKVRNFIEALWEAMKSGELSDEVKKVIKEAIGKAEK
jgi:DNA repair exonuclease SbcCD nuclease subunit